MKTTFKVIIITGILFIIALGIREYSKDESHKKHIGDTTLTVTELSGWEEVKKPVFCVKVKPFYKETYCIVFSNDNFETEQAINNVMDITMFGEPDKVSVDPYLTREYQEAVNYAKKFTNYQQCIEHNKRVDKDVAKKLAHYKKHPPKDEYAEYRDVPATRETVIYCEEN